MTEANISYFRDNDSEAEIVDRVNCVNRTANIPGFARFHLFSADTCVTFGVSVRHGLGEASSVRVFLCHPQSGHKIEISPVFAGGATIFYPGPVSRRAGYPRLEVTHGEVSGKPETVDITGLLIERFGLQ